MKLSELIQRASWADVKDSLLAEYSENVKRLPSYEQVFNNLSLMTPRASTMCICIEERCEPTWDGTPYKDVCGKNNASCEIPRRLKSPENYTDGDYTDSKTTFALDFTPWEEWLGMEIDASTLRRFSAPEIVAHCLWEMTYYGFSQAKIDAVRDEVHAEMKAIRKLKNRN